MKNENDGLRCVCGGYGYCRMGYDHAPWCKHSPEYGLPAMCTCPDDRGDAGLHHLDCCPLHYDVQSKSRIIVRTSPEKRLLQVEHIAYTKVAQ